ncbi:YncE family protein, partial [Rhodococcus marinonascens]|uniref:YncE family protein n=1 Tax=Rhodococcus marinonascens TaxID=38311 RepID=UPI000A6373BD
MNQHNTVCGYRRVGGRAARLTLGVTATFAMVLGMAGMGVAAAAADTVIDTVPVGNTPAGVAVTTPDGTRAYVTNRGGASVSVIDTATNMVVGLPIPVGTNPFGVAITLDGTRAYVTNSGGTSVSVIDTATNMVVGLPIPVGTNP